MFGFNNSAQQNYYWLSRDQQGYFMIPYRLVDKALEDTVYAGSSGFEQILAMKQPFVEFTVKTYKQARKNMPEGWTVEKDGLVVMEGNTLIGTISSDRAAKHGLKSAREYKAFVVPPCKDPYEGIPISDVYKLIVIL